jgi:sec-independent protein translocase protein TatA
MLGLGLKELVIILLIVVLLFGAKKIPELGRALGESIKNLREGFKDDQDKKDANTKK